MSDADGVNPLVVTKGTKAKENWWACQQVDLILEEAAAIDQMEWDPSKNSSVTFGTQGKSESTTMLGIGSTQP